MKQRIAFALLMGIITTGIITFTLAAANLGFTPNFLLIWMKSWSMAYVIVIPCILFVGPLVQKVVGMLFNGKKMA